MLGMLVLGLNGKISSYYYSKGYYLLSMILVYSAICYFCKVSHNNKEIIWGFIGMIVLVTFIHYGNIEEKISNKSVYFNNKNVSKVFYSLYDFNIEKSKSEGYNNARLQLYDWINENTSLSDKVADTSYYEYCYWFNALTNRRGVEYTYFNAERYGKNYLENIKDVQYVIVDVSSVAYDKYKEYFDSLSKQYINEVGFIAEIN